jgi:hypothetical protein
VQLLQQSEATAAQRRMFFHAVDATDGITAETGLTGAGRLSKNGAATAATTANIVEVDSTNMPGRYYIEFTAAEIDTVGVIEFRFKAAACAEVVARAQVVPFDPYDAVRQGMTALPNAAAGAAGGLLTCTNANELPANAIVAASLATDSITAAKIAADAIGASEFAQAAADKVWSSAARTLTAFSTALAVAVWDVLEAAIVTASSIGLKVKTNLDAAITSRLATASYTAPDNASIAAILTDTNELQTDWVNGGRLDLLIDAIKAKSDNLPSGVQKNTALNNFEFLMVDSTNQDPATGLAVTATRSIDGAAFAACANAVVEVANGIYKINLANTDLNGDVVTLRFTAAAAEDRLVTIITEP